MTLTYLITVFSNARDPFAVEDVVLLSMAFSKWSASVDRAEMSIVSRRGVDRLLMATRANHCLPSLAYTKRSLSTNSVFFTPLLKALLTWLVQLRGLSQEVHFDCREIGAKFMTRRLSGSPRHASRFHHRSSRGTPGCVNVYANAMDILLMTSIVTVSPPSLMGSNSSPCQNLRLVQ